MRLQPFRKLWPFRKKDYLQFAHWLTICGWQVVSQWECGITYRASLHHHTKMISAKTFSLRLHNRTLQQETVVNFDCLCASVQQPFVFPPCCRGRTTTCSTSELLNKFLLILLRVLLNWTDSFLNSPKLHTLHFNLQNLQSHWVPWCRSKTLIRLT